MDIEWKSDSGNAGHSSHYTFQYLRDACPCATCDEERDQTGRELGARPKSTNALPMYKDPIRPTAVERVGNYAISFTWNDGHHAGIYTWDFLRAMCPCEECKAKLAAS